MRASTIKMKSVSASISVFVCLASLLVLAGPEVDCLANHDYIVQAIGAKLEPAKIWSVISDTIKSTIAPELEYLYLIRRYQVWHGSYNLLRKDWMKSSLEVLKEEYARVDEEFQKQFVCNGMPYDQNMDYVYKTLQIVINNLEQSLDNLRNNQEKLDDPNIRLDTINSIEEEQVKRSMENFKNALVTSAKAFISNQAKNFAQFALINGAVVLAKEPLLMDGKADPSSSLVLPILEVIGRTSTDLLALYLRNLEMRTAVNLVNRFNPKKIVCQIGSNLSSYLLGKR